MELKKTEITSKGLDLAEKPFPVSVHEEKKWESSFRIKKLFRYVLENQSKLPNDISEEKYYEFLNTASLELYEEPLTDSETRSRGSLWYKAFCRKREAAQVIAPTLAELLKMDFKPKESLVEKFIFKGQMSIIGARPKYGKSTLIRFLCKCIVDGLDFLGRKTSTGSILYLAMEEHIDDVRQDFIDMGIKNAEKIRVTNLPDCTSALEYFEKLDLIARAYNPDLVIVDTMIHLLGVKDINDYSSTTVALKSFRAFAEKYNTHVLLIHHNRKGEGSGNESLLGSTGISGAVDLIMDIKMVESDKKRVFLSHGRSSQEHFEETPLNFDFKTKSFLADEEYDATEDIQEKILTAIRSKSFKNVEEIRTEVTGKTSVISKSVRTLMESGLVEKIEGKYVVKKEEGQNDLE